MSGGEIVALVSVVVTGLAAPWISTRMARRQAQLQTRWIREDELRSVLEHAGVRLTEAIFRVGELRARPSELDQRSLAPLQEELEQLWKNEDRIRVRLGSSAAEAQHYRRAIVDGIARAGTILHEGLAGGFDQSSFRLLSEAH